MDAQRSRHPAIEALALHGRLIVTDPPDDLRALAIADPPDVVIVDALGKGQRVEHRVARLRRHPALASAAIVVTGVSVTEPSLAVRLFDAGADDCLTDPLTPEVLSARVRRLLARRHLPESDAIGRLAGGVAHNFNNLLTVILISSEMLMAELPQDSPAWRPVDVDLNAAIRDLTGVLQGVVGENVTLVVSPEDGLPSVHVDPSQIQRAILDLATHARDAMPDGGTMIVETRRVVLTEAYVAQQITVEPGVYVLLALSDTGSGMDPEMQLHLFEPFYAKGRGAVSGVGLSAVHGIVRQSGGHIWVYSEPGHGTTFKIYLPEASSRARTSTSKRRSKALPRGRAYRQQRRGSHRALPRPGGSSPTCSLPTS